jgi:hypothetical protein
MAEQIPTVAEAQAKIADLTAQRDRWGAALAAHQSELAALEADMGAIALDAEPGAVEALTAKIADLSARAKIAQRALAELGQREEAARHTLTRARAQELRQRAQELRQQAERIDAEAAPHLAALEQLQGVAYVAYAPPQPVGGLVYVDPQPVKLPRSVALRDQAEGMERTAAQLERDLAAALREQERPQLRLLSSAA